MELHLAPGAATTAHDHHDTEAWFILRGHGEITEGDTTYAVAAGDIIDLAPLKKHMVRNTSTSEIFTFISIWWDDPHATMQAHARLAPPGARDPVEMLVLEGVNMGHQPDRGVGADIFLRAARNRGDHVRSPVDVLGADRLRSSSQDIFDALRQQGLILQKREEVTYCERCSEYRFDTDTRVLEATCARCGRPTTPRSLERSCFRPGLMQEPLAELLDRCQMSPTLRSAFARALAGDLPDVAVTGRPEPEHPRFLGWFEQVAHHVAAVDHAPHARLIQFLEPDEVSPRSLVLPAALIARMGARAPAVTIIEPRRGPAVGGGSLEDGFAREARGWVHDVQARLREFFDCTVPEAGPWSPEATWFYGDIVTVRAEVARALDPAAFSVERAYRALLRFIESARHFGQTIAPLLGRGIKTRQHLTHMALEMMAIRTVASLSAPICPGFAADASRALAEADLPAAVCTETAPAWIAPGTRVDSLGRRGLEVAS